MTQPRYAPKPRAASSATKGRLVARDFVELLGNFLIDAETDISVAAHDRALSGACFIRLRRARDTLACAQTLLETMSEIAGKKADTAGTSPSTSEAERDLGTIIAAAMRRGGGVAGKGVAGRLPAGAVESVKLRLYTGFCCNCIVHKTDECKPSKVFHRHNCARRAVEGASRLARNFRRLHVGSVFPVRSIPVPTSEPSRRGATHGEWVARPSVRPVAACQPCSHHGQYGWSADSRMALHVAARRQLLASDNRRHARGWSVRMALWRKLLGAHRRKRPGIWLRGLSRCARLLHP